MIRWLGGILLALGLPWLTGCDEEEARPPATLPPPAAAIIPPAPERPTPTGDKLADALADAQWRLAQAKSAEEQAKSEIKTLREEQDRERQAAYQRWFYGITIGAFAAAAICVGLGIWLSLLRGMMFGIAGAFATIGVLCLTAAALIPYLMWVLLAVAVLVILVVAWALSRSDRALGKVTAVVDKFTETAQPAVVENLLTNFRGVMDDADKMLVRKHRARRLQGAHRAGPANPRT